MSSPPATSTPARNGRDPTDDERDHTPMMANELASTNGNANGDSGHNQHADDNPPAPSSEHSANDSHMNQRGEKQIKPNKVYIGGLPEQTRQEDLQACFGKIGTIVSIELKLGYGFVEFDSREAAEESVAKYHEGYFMGNKIRVELSHGGGRTAKYVGEPGACFKCGTHGHWARECPNNAMPGYRGRDEGRYSDRKEHGHHPAPYPPREYPPYREDYARYSAAASRDRYLDYYAPPPPAREYRGPPARETRDAYPPQPRGGRDDEYRRMAPAPYREERPAYYAHYESMPPPPRDSAYPPRPYSGAVERGRPPYPGYSAPPAPTRREDYDRSSRDYPPPPAEYRSSHPSYSIDTAGAVRPLLHTGMHLLTNVMPLVTVATPQATLLGRRSPATPAVLDPLAHDAKPLGTEATGGENTTPSQSWQNDSPCFPGLDAYAPVPFLNSTGFSMRSDQFCQA